LYTLGVRNYDGFENDPEYAEWLLTTSPESQSKSGSWLDSFSNIFNKAAGIVTTGVNTYNAVRTGQTSESTQNALTASQIQAQQAALEIQAQQEASRQKVTQYVIVGVILVVVIVAAVLIFKKK
jgi:cobalamin biosynthesis Mg chelatase CobN